MTDHIGNIVHERVMRRRRALVVNNRGFSLQANNTGVVFSGFRPIEANFDVQGKRHFSVLRSPAQ